MLELPIVYKKLDQIHSIHNLFVISKHAFQAAQTVVLYWIDLLQQHPTKALAELYSRVAPPIFDLLLLIVVTKLILSVARKRAALKAGSDESVQRQVLMRLDKHNRSSGYGTRSLSALQISRQTVPRIVFDRLFLRPAPVILTDLV